MTVSIMIYYTPEFYDVTKENVKPFIDHIIKLTNIGRIYSYSRKITLFITGLNQSGIPLTIVAHCYEMASFSETGDDNYLDQFEAMKNGHDELRNSADAAALFVADHKLICGQAISSNEVKKYFSIFIYFIL